MFISCLDQKGALYKWKNTQNYHLRALLNIKRRVPKRRNIGGGQNIFIFLSFDDRNRSHIACTCNLRLKKRFLTLLEQFLAFFWRFEAFSAQDLCTILVRDFAQNGRFSKKSFKILHFALTFSMIVREVYPWHKRFKAAPGVSLGAFQAFQFIFSWILVKNRLNSALKAEI